MKKMILLAALAATAGFTACNKENESVNPSGDNVVIVRLPDNVNARTVEAPVAGSSVTANISDVTVFLLNGDVVAKVYEFTDGDKTAGEAHIENVPAAVSGVLVVANIPSADATALKALNSASAVKSYPFTAASQNGAGSIAKQTLMGSSTSLSTAVDDTDHPGRKYRQCTVALDALTARFEIAGVTAGTGVESVEIVSVWINKFYTTNAKTAPQTYQSNDVVWDVTGATVGTPSATPFTTYTLATYPYTEYQDDGDGDVTASATPTKVYAYQVFAGANVPHLILLVKGKYANGFYSDGKPYFMGYLTFTKFNESGTPIASVLNNTIYKVGHSAEGIKINADEITPEPENPIFDLGVNVTLTGWTEKNVTPGL